ncbi:hypothetical protein S820908_038 [Synechococcus phage S-CAM9]|uniref:Uncharacterized protein n=1 Tax=Synechococcus phage S-CAM9 TaxID=1883369 RepID=A0A1D8KPN6_9CAUD|nr:hypothetical protein BOW85_gp211 [Synechococcus phage S-CAM9]AOV60185.1 hypothetical protein S050808_038 [Synechococcus phage S-CAM9]AOV60413.1 hypothetical protein S820908_038 [Synechococcus phage S-CAM9]AOV60641.1 hypothetical protein N161109_038 [Synechococcus phage S-CAM9]
MTITQSKPQFLTEALVEVLNNQWKVDAIESDRQVYTQLEIEEGRKYIKLCTYLVSYGNRERGRSAYMFVDKKSGECYKSASWKSPAKGVRYLITQLIDHPEICDPYGSFLYL